MPKNKAAQQLGRLGGKAAAASLSAAERIEKARQAAEARWGNQTAEDRAAQMERVRAGIKPASRRNRWAGKSAAERKAAMARARAARKPKAAGEGAPRAGEGEAPKSGNAKPAGSVKKRKER